MNNGFYNFPSKITDTAGDIVTFDTSSVYRIPNDAKMLAFLVIGGGGGGGAGSQTASGVSAYGPSGGAGGGAVSHLMLASDFGGPGTVLYIAIGAGGIAGTPGGASSTGGTGGAGGNTTISVAGLPGTFITALGGGGGTGGAITTGTSAADPIHFGTYSIAVSTLSTSAVLGASYNPQNYSGGSSNSSAASSVRYGDPGNCLGGGGGGGMGTATAYAGGGIILATGTSGDTQSGLQTPYSSSNTFLNGGAATGAVGESASFQRPNPFGLLFWCGSGGAGGGSNLSGVGGAGGTGIRGGGGGGGGSSLNGSSAGAGGVGGNGFVAIMVYR